MPKVRGKHYPYTPSGYKAAAKARKSKPATKRKPHAPATGGVRG